MNEQPSKESPIFLALEVQKSAIAELDSNIKVILVRTEAISRIGEKSPANLKTTEADGSKVLTLIRSNTEIINELNYILHNRILELEV